MKAFYKCIDDIENDKYDGLIITGAPVENLPFEEVDYWQELCRVMTWSRTNVFSTLHICWAAQAGLYFHYGIPKYPLDSKMFGVFTHHAELPTHPLVRGFDETFKAPHSRHTEVRASDIRAVSSLRLVASSDIAGPYLIASENGRMVFVTGHAEYDRDTLASEYFRDKSRGLNIALPYGYFPDNDPEKEPRNQWRGHAHLLFSNWLNYCVYQQTPFDLSNIGGR